MYIQSKYKVLLIRILILLMFFSISRMLMLILNPTLFGEIGWAESFSLWFYGLRFDISVLLMLNGLFILLYTLPLAFSSNRKYMKVIDISVITINSIAILVNAMDAVFFRFTLRRTTFDFFDLLAVNNGFLKLIPSFIVDFWYVPLIWIVISLLLIKLYLKIGKKTDTIIVGWIFYIKQTVFFLLAAGLIILGIRGGFQPIPIILIDAAVYTDANKVPIVLNTPFTILKTIESGSIKSKSYYTDKELDAIFTPEHLLLPDDSLQKKQMNVVLIILESFSAEHFRFFNKDMQDGKYQGFTPFLDSLFEKSLVFKGIANGKRSIDGIPAIISGLPNLMDRAFIISTYAGNRINSLAETLKRDGYSTAFFHGGENGSMNFNAYAKQAGFDKYFGKNEYNNDDDFDGNWGIWDEKFFQYYAKEMSNMKAPFFTSIFSLSSHHPYSIPDEHKGKFREGKLPIQQAVMYADYSLKQFFETASKMPWYTNTLFVITADHTSEGYLPFYSNSVGQYQVPIAFFAPSDSILSKRKTRKVVQQTDIFPTVLDYLNYNDTYVAFGSSVFDTLTTGYGITYSNNYIQFIKDGYLLRAVNDETKGFFDLKSDSLLTNNIADINNPVQNKMERFLKAYVQQYNNRMINNKLSLGSSK